MNILTVRTEKPDAEIGIYSNAKELAYFSWQAHRQLAETIHQNILNELENKNLDYNQIDGIAIYKGPGSFTGLRIGFSVSNALAHSLQIPIVSESNENWIQNAIDRLIKGENERVSVPEYGSPPHITQPKH